MPPPNTNASAEPPKSAAGAPTPADVYEQVTQHGASRAAALEAAEDHFADAILVVVAALEAGTALNLARVARHARVAKQTLYSSLPRDLIAARQADPAEN